MKGASVVILVLIGTLVSINDACSQTFSTRDFINSAFNDPIVLNINDQNNFLETADMSLPAISEVEIRTRSNDLDFSLDDVRLRLGVTNFGQVRENKKYNDLLVINYDLEYQVRVHLALLSRYSLILEYASLQDELDWLQRKRLNSEDFTKVSKAALMNGSGSIDDLARAERNLTEIAVKESQLQMRGEEIKSKMLTMHSFSGPVVISKDSLVDLLSVSDLVENMNLLLIEQTNPNLAKKQQDIELDVQETELEIKESRGDFGFFQAEYEIDPNASTSENLGYQLGFQLPITNTDKSKIELRKLSDLKRQQALTNLQVKYNLEINHSRDLIRDQISRQNMLQEDYTSALERSQLIKGRHISIEALLRMQQNNLVLEKVKTDLQYDILESYLKFLDLSGTLSQYPLRNYIFKGLETL